jgi:hypothetical protein
VRALLSRNASLSLLAGIGGDRYAVRDAGLEVFAEAALPEKQAQIRWIRTTLRESAVQVLVVS